MRRARSSAHCFLKASVQGSTPFSSARCRGRDRGADRESALQRGRSRAEPLTAQASHARRRRDRPEAGFPGDQPRPRLHSLARLRPRRSHSFDANAQSYHYSDGRSTGILIHPGGITPGGCSMPVASPSQLAGATTRTSGRALSQPPHQENELLLAITTLAFMSN
jgi:hypothetical protein